MSLARLAASGAGAIVVVVGVAVPAAHAQTTTSSSSTTSTTTTTIRDVDDFCDVMLDFDAALIAYNGADPETLEDVMADMLDVALEAQALAPSDLSDAMDVVVSAVEGTIDYLESSEYELPEEGQDLPIETDEFDAAYDDVIGAFRDDNCRFHASATSTTTSSTTTPTTTSTTSTTAASSTTTTTSAAAAGTTTTAVPSSVGTGSGPGPGPGASPPSVLGTTLARTGAAGAGALLVTGGALLFGGQGWRRTMLRRARRR